MTHEAKSRWLDLATLALIAALVLLFFWRILTPRMEDRADFPPGDFTDQFWAFRQYEARAFAEGRLPLWSDNFNSGHPFLADVQSALFYPLSLIWTLGIVALRGANFTLLDLEIEAIAHFILAGVFMYLFARRVLGSRAAALTSALTFIFGGYLTAYPPQQLAILETATWLPLALLLLDLATGRGIRYYIAAGIVLGIAALAGHPQTWLFMVYACVIYYAWRVASERRRRAAEEQGNKGASPLRPGAAAPLRSSISLIVQSASRFAIAIVVAAGIAAAQWIPTLEYQSASTRATISWAEAARGFPTLDPLQMILPGYASAFQSPLYVGIFPLWLALLGFFVNRSREKIFWAGLALGSLLVSFGSYVFAYAVLYLFAPGFGMFRDQERLAFIVSFALAILAGYGMRDLTQPALDLRARRAWPLLPAGITISLLMLFTLYIAAKEHPTGRLFFLGDRAGLMTLLFVLASVLAAARLADLLKPDRFVVYAILLIAFDLFSINSAAYNAEPRPRYPVTPIVQAIESDPGIFRVADEGKMPGHFGIAYNLEEIGSISPLRVRWYDALLDLPEEKLWPLLNVRYVITGRPGFADAEVVAQDGETRLLRLQAEMPRAWFVPYALRNPSDREVLAALQSDAFDPWYSAYLAETPPFPLPSPPIRREGGKSAHAAEFQRLDPEHSRVIVNAPADGVVMLSQNYYYPGWRATVDGVPTPILRANVSLTAVAVRAGAQQVEFVFDPWSVKIGIVISVVTIVAIIIGLASSQDNAEFQRLAEI